MTLPSALRHLEQLEPVARNFMQRLLTENSKPLVQMSVAEAREYMLRSQPTTFTNLGVSVQVCVIVGVRCVVLRPVDRQELTLPVVLYLHGGGWVLGAPETHARLTGVIAEQVDCAVVIPDYALAPEHRYPVALNQVHAIAQELQAGCLPYSDGRRLAVAGDSAGGNLAAALALICAKNIGGVRLALQALLCPALQPGATTASYRAYSEGFNLPAETMLWFWRQYAPDTSDWDEPELCPLQAADDLLARVTPALIVTAGCDVLRDEGEDFGRRLLMSGNAATVLRCEGTVHNFPVIDDLSASGPSIAATAALCAALREALHSRPMDSERNADGSE